MYSDLYYTTSIDRSDERHDKATQQLISVDQSLIFRPLCQQCKTITVHITFI